MTFERYIESAYNALRAVVAGREHIVLDANPMNPGIVFFRGRYADVRLQHAAPERIVAQVISHFGEPTYQWTDYLENTQAVRFGATIATEFVPRRRPR
jgi:hypothetical protein